MTTPNGTMKPVLLGLLMAVAGLLPASLLAIDNATIRALFVLAACLAFLLVGVFLPSPRLPDSMTSGRHKVVAKKKAPPTVRRKGPEAKG